MDAPTFIRKWTGVQLSERAASQEHFLDLCRLLGQPTPAEHDATGAEYTFEKGVAVAGAASPGSKGERGFADVWWDQKFGWEYKRQGKYKTLGEAYKQLLQYREALNNPPLLIVSDIDRIEIRTNFTGFKTEVHEIELEQLTDPGVVSMLKRVFTDPLSFKPDETAEQVTEKAAKAIGTIAHALRDRGHDPHDTAHFLMKVMFCLFAEDVNLLPKDLFKSMLTKCRRDPSRLKSQMDTLFDAMRTGGDFGVEEIAYFNGGLFDEDDALELTEKEIATLIDAADKDWGAVEPSVFGTLFERSLDPTKRAQIGAHYTSREDIMLVIEPVIVRHLRRGWDETLEEIDQQLERRRKAKTPATKKKADTEIADLLDGFQQRLASVRVLDPACGSGNFLYVAIQQLLALEKEVILFASRKEIGVGGLLPKVRPTQLLGIEINPYAAELAQVVIWIGYLQWMRDNGFNAPRDPILEPINTIENRDAILAWADEAGEPVPTWREGAACLGKAEWPEAEYIVGNPPFLGSKLFRQNGLPDSYIEAMYTNFDLPNTSDLCCYWFELACDRLIGSSVARYGLLATQAIRGGDNRAVLKKIHEHAVIFNAWSDKNWVLNGAAVHVSIACFANTDEITRLNGIVCATINPSLTADISLSTASTIISNEGIAFMGSTKGGPFELNYHAAKILLLEPNPHSKSNIDVIRPWINGSDLTKRRRGYWIIDFGSSASIEEASLYDAPFSSLEEQVKTTRKGIRDAGPASRWWLHNRPRPDLRDAVSDLNRFVVTCRVSKFRLFKWFTSPTLPDSATFAFARSDDYFFGVLHSAVHELWALRQGTQLEDRPRYTPTTCFETFPLPWPPGEEPAESEPGRDLHDAIAASAKTLDEQRERWLNPPEWIERIAERVDAEDDFADVARVSGEEARRLIRQSAIDAAAAKDKDLKKRTLTNLYNERPTWLRLAHTALDEAVLAAYAHVDPEGAWERSMAEVFEETGAGFPLPEGHDLAEKREEVEQSILGDLLRMNLERAGAEGSDSPS